MDDSTKKALTQVVFASLQNSKKKLKIDLVFSDSVFKSGEQIVMPHELAEMILPIARRSLNSKEDYTTVLTEIVTSVQNNGFNVDNVLKEEASTQVPATPCRLALPTFEGCFSDKMNAYIHSTALELGVLPNGIVGTVIAACSAALPGNCRLRIGTKYTEHPTLWVALVGMSSTKKTPSLKTVLGFFEKKQAQFTIENQLNEISYKKSMLRYEVEVANFRKKAIQNKTLMAPDEPKKPIWKDIYLSDATIEAVLHSCSQNPRGIMYFGDEMSGWLGQLSRQNAVKERAQWLEGFNSGRYEQSRIGRGRVALDCFRIVVFGGLQPHVVDKMLNDDNVDGLAGRFLFVQQDNHGYPTNSIDPKHVAYLDMVLEKLYQTQQCEVCFKPEALELFNRTTNQYAKELNGLPDSHWRAFIGKRSGLLARLILIWHSIERAEEGKFASEELVDISVVSRMTRFVEMFLRRSSAIIYEQSGIQIPDSGDGIVFSSKEKTVLRWLKDQAKNGRMKFSARDLYMGSYGFQQLKRAKTDGVFLEALSASGLASIETTGKSFVVTLSDYLKQWEIR